MIFQTFAPVIERRLPAIPDRQFALPRRPAIDEPSAPKQSWLRRMWLTATQPLSQSQRPVSSPHELKRRRELLAKARIALLQGRINDAERTLATALQINRRDAVCLNLQGIVHEVRQQWRMARRCYGCAMRIDRSFLPAEQNMRRLYELWTFGKSRLPIAIWEPPIKA